MKNVKFAEKQLRDARAELEELREARDVQSTTLTSSLLLSQDQEAGLRQQVCDAEVGIDTCK